MNTACGDRCCMCPELIFLVSPQLGVHIAVGTSTPNHFWYQNENVHTDLTGEPLPNSFPLTFVFCLKPQFLRREQRRWTCLHMESLDWMCNMKQEASAESVTRSLRRNTYSLTIFERVCLYWSERACSQLDQTHTVHCDVCVVNLAWDHCHMSSASVAPFPLCFLSRGPPKPQKTYFSTYLSWDLAVHMATG